MVKYPVETSLREFIYHALYTLPEENKFDLKGVYYRIGRSSYYSRKFCDTASRDQIFHLAAMLGIKWFMVFYDDRKKEIFIRDLLAHHKEETQNTSLTKIVQRKIYVTTDKKFIHSLGLLADNISNPAYKQSMEIDKAGFHARKWRKTIDMKNSQSLDEHSDTIDYLAETVMNAFLVVNQSRLQQYDVLILFYFYRNRNRYVPYQTLFNKFEWGLGQLKIKRAVGRMLKLEFIQKHPKAHKKDFQITSMGILEVHRIIDALLKSNVF